MPNNDETPQPPTKFDFSAFPPDTLFYDRRSGLDRRDRPAAGSIEAANEFSNVKSPERRAKKERRRRIDPTTFEKQYTDDELEFMNAVQQFKTQSGKPFPSHGDVLRIAARLGYRKSYPVDDFVEEPSEEVETCLPR
jgi:hypothetical protein